LTFQDLNPRMSQLAKSWVGMIKIIVIQKQRLERKKREKEANTNDREKSTEFNNNPEITKLYILFFQIHIDTMHYIHTYTLNKRSYNVSCMNCRV